MALRGIYEREDHVYSPTDDGWDVHRALLQCMRERTDARRDVANLFRELGDLWFVVQTAAEQLAAGDADAAESTLAAAMAATSVDLKPVA